MHYFRIKIGNPKKTTLEWLISVVDSATKASGEWRAHWPVVFAAGSGMALSTLISYSLALFIEPLQKEFGWSRAEITSGQIIAAAMAIVLGPIAGGLIDRIGPRLIGICGAVLMCLATAMLSLATASIAVWHVLWVIVAIAVVLIQPTVWTSAVTSLFNEGRGLALAATLCGSGIASLVTPPLTYALIQNFGWRTAFVFLPAAWGIVIVPILVLLFRTPLRARSPGKPRESERFGNVLSEALRRHVITSRFACLAVAGLAFAMVAVTLAVSIVPLLQDYGLPRSNAAHLASLIGLAAIAGRLTIGFLLDRLPARFVGSLCACLPIPAVLLLLTGGHSLATAAMAVLIIGVSLGAELDILAYLTSRYFDRGNFGLLFGILGGLVTIAGGCGPVLLNVVFDATGTYRLALVAVIPLCALAAFMFLLLGPYPRQDPDQKSNAAEPDPAQPAR